MDFQAGVTVNDNYFSDISVSPRLRRTMGNVTESMFRKSTIDMMSNNPIEGRASMRLERILSSGLMSNGSNKNVPESINSDILCIAFSPDGMLIATG